MQKKSKIIIISVVTAILLIVGVFTAIALTGKGDDIEKVATEKLSLGQKFLLDLEYDKAVAEFQAVIDIEPKNVDAYIGLADAYIGMGEEEKAIEALEKGFSETGDETIRAKLEELKKPEETTVAETTTTPEVTTTPPETTTEETTTTPEETTAEKSGWTERVDYDCCYMEYEYDSNGRIIREACYDIENDFPSYYCYPEYDLNGNLVRERMPVIPTTSYRIYEYDTSGKLIKRTIYNEDDSVDAYTTYFYDSNNKLTKRENYSEDYESKQMQLYRTEEYDSNENLLRQIFPEKDGGRTVYEYNSEGKRIRTIYYEADGTYSINDGEKTTYYNADGTVDYVSENWMYSNGGGANLNLVHTHKPGAQYNLGEKNSL